MVLWFRVVRETFGKKPDFSGAWITRVKVRDWASFAFFILPFFIYLNMLLWFLDFTMVNKLCCILLL
jgi:hypothetical protein